MGKLSHTIHGTKETIEIFGDRAKNGVVHLKTTKFILRQNSLIASLKEEFIDKGTETKMVVINGLPFDRNEALEKLIIDMDDKAIESSLFSEVGLVVLVPQPITNTIKIIIVLFMVLS